MKCPGIIQTLQQRSAAVLHQTVLVDTALVESTHFYSEPNTVFMFNACVVGSNTAEGNLTVRKFAQFLPGLQW